jgi:phosphinothricin acetyltransferase
MKIIRMATPADATAILSIYAPYIISTAYTFETEVPSLESFEQRIINCLETWPWSVCEIDGAIAGYAYAAKHRERAAYQWCVESSVYIHDSFQKKGVAKLLYDSLFEILKLQGFINVYAGITLPNDKSVAFHERYGFTKFAEYNNIGYKLGKWNTVSWWQLHLREYPENPIAPLKLLRVEPSFLEKILG